ncbi:ABC transporter substrate-binding protein [Caloramator sp. ALD01]|uniref:ABC transporter substrate-binding protein n=1 Tax=Caloramator sp. ALD01 TaxID=1031288 RepID=UPI0003FC1FC9|nr:ABC transporter substrate-binding protein [Caloramator sp. ALD01]
MKIKKYLGILLSTVLVTTSLVGCGPKKTSENKEKLEVDKTKVLRVWSFTDELKEPLKYFEQKYGIKTELTIVPTENYASKLQPVLDSGVGAPDVFTAEIAWVKQWIDLPYWENLSGEPYNADKWADDYVPYVYNIGKDMNGNVKALSWQATPGGFIYKRWIARKVWGNDDPAFVAQKLSSMENFMKAAEELKQAGYKILPDEGAIRWFAKGSDPKPWVNEKNELQLTQAQIDFMDYQKKLRDNEYTALAPEWSPAWFASMQGQIPINAGWEKDVNKVKGNKTEVFGYVMPTWGLHYVIKPNAKETAGDWGLTSGPSPYFWGGTWIGIYSGSKNKGAAWEFVKMMTHDEEFLNWWYKKTGDLLSYKPVTEKVKDTAKDEFLKGQNHYEFFLKEAEKINPNIVTKYDQGIDTIWGNVVKEYIEGKKTKDAAINEFYKQVKNAYPEIKTPLDK